MNRDRAQAYRRVTRTLDELGPSKLQADEQERVRVAADTLIFSSELVDAVAAREALADVEGLAEALVESGRWEPVTARRLVEDVGACGPAMRRGLQAA